MGKLTDINNDEKEAIEKLRNRLKDMLTAELYEDDVLFYRFLKARNFDIEKAELMLRKHLILRKALKFDTILQDFKPKETFTRFFMGSYIGEDKEGYPVQYFPAGKVDTRDIVKCFTSNDYLKHWLWAMESDIDHFKEINKKTGKNIWKFVIILDVDQLEFANACHPYSASFVLALAQGYQENFPEILRFAFIINAPKYFVMLYSVLKKVLDPEVIGKFLLYGKSGWKEELVKHIDPDVLPAFLGGTRTDPDGNPMCYTFINHGGRIPKTYHLTKEEMTFKDKSNVKNIKISAGKSVEIPIEIKKTGSVIEWEYEIQSKDIDFGLYYKGTDKELQEILPLFKRETWFGVEKDSYKCQKTGTYVIIFDNCRSWLNGKEISYCIRVVEPE